MIDIGHMGENTAASHSRNVKVKVVLELTGGRSVCVCEIGNQDEGRLIPSPPVIVIKALSSQRRNTVFVEYDENVLITELFPQIEFSEYSRAGIYFGSETHFYHSFIKFHVTNMKLAKFFLVVLL